MTQQHRILMGVEGVQRAGRAVRPEADRAEQPPAAGRLRENAMTRTPKSLWRNESQKLTLWLHARNNRLKRSEPGGCFNIQPGSRTVNSLIYLILLCPMVPGLLD